MAVFERSVQVEQTLDYQLMANGSVTLFWQPEVLNKTTGWLAKHGYQVVRVDTSGWRSDDDLHDGLSLALDFPEYYGRNLAALNDSLSDVAAGDLGWTDDDTGLVLVLEHYDAFATADPALAHHLLDVFAVQARHALLIGHRLLCLVQSDNPDLVLTPVGATPIPWNPIEWLDSARHP
ncbi:barstar family protein [Kribbella sp. VKM Ac-2568]|uniref:barstar family protein n=1 Tax=Kribbella sp. VKM Ac-2568 TaxID=2512219 RepID=UPI0010ED1C0E|nr:barstar family protein [Kribbella sp. VKM Ac-2568]TCM47713.1 barstar (barnase inhibitor) [Kribbella sp. VKM Ac-2568]